MKFNKWTLGLAAAGVVSLGSVTQAEEQKSALQTALSQTVISGSISTSVILNPNSATLLPGRAFDGTGFFGTGIGNKQDGFNLDHVRLQLERPMGEGEWAAGYKVEMIFGPDALPYGTGSIGGAAFDFAFKQAYVALRAPVGNGLDLKLGVWDTIIGYETFNPADNPNFSRSYAYFVEPYAHTGLLASYRINDELSVSAGIANSTSGGILGPNQINARGDGEFRIRYMASVAYTVPEDAGFLKGSTLYGGFVSSEDGATVGGPGDGYNVYLGGTLATPVEGLRVGAAFDAVVADSAADTYVYGLYATFQATEQVRISGRGEFVQDNAGLIFFGPSGQEVMSLVGTVDYKVWENVLTRAEVRWDKDVDGGSGNAFGGQDDQVQFVLNVVYSF
jgi:hypothetical protein